MSFFAAPPDSISGTEYITTLHKYLRANLPRLAPAAPPPASFLQQSYTLLTLGLDPTSQPLSRSVKVPLTLGFGKPSTNKAPIRPLPLRLPPDRLLYLLLRWQALPQQLPHVGRTDEPIAEGVPYTSRGATEGKARDGDVQSVRSWVGSMRSVSMGSIGVGGWFNKEEPTEDQLLLALYQMFTILPALLIHPPFHSDPTITDLVDAGGYTQFGGIDVRVPLDVMRNLQILELEYDPRALLIPSMPNLRNLTIRHVQDADDWIEELLVVDDKARFPNLRHLSLSGSLISFPSLPLDSLTSLDLSHNLLNDIPPLPESLVSLNLSHNLISSVRNAQLGSVRSINLSNNRIDCLAGLDQSMLQRIDVRKNEITEYGEIGRLAVLLHIKEVWCADNALTNEQDWRVKLGATFVAEGRTIIVDDADWTWMEERAIDARLKSQGRPKHARTPTMPAQLADRQTARSVTMPQPAVPSDALTRQKRRPRRVINLDSNEGISNLSVKNSAIPESTSEILAAPTKTRSRIDAQTFKTP